MKRLLLALAMLALAVPSVAVAQDKAPSPLDTGKLTILQLINIADALRQLGDYRDRDGKPVKVPFEFDGAMRMRIAINISHADAAQQIYQTQRNELLQKMLGDRQQRLAALDKAAAAETDAAAKARKTEQAEALRAEASDILQKFNEQDVRMLTAPGGALLSRIKESDLCMAAKPVPPCTTANAIPPSLLAALVPIIDR